MKITIRMDVDPDDAPVRGNAIATEDMDLDKKVEDEILARLERGDVWAWALVHVEARLEIDKETFIGCDTLGGCSYKDEAEFRKDGSYEDMKDRAIEDMWASVRAAVKRGHAAVSALLAKQRNVNIEIEEA